MSLCSVPFRVRRSAAAAAAALDGYDSPHCYSSSPLRDPSSLTSSPAAAAQQLLLVRRRSSSSGTSSGGGKRQQFKTSRKLSSSSSSSALPAPSSSSSSSSASASASVLQRSISMSGKKLNKMRSIVKHWRKLTHTSQSRYLSLADNRITGSGRQEQLLVAEKSRRDTGGIGGYDSCFFSSSSSSTLSDLEDDCSPRSVKHLARSAVTDDVPDGYLALFVGRERRRFVIGAHYLEHNLFRGLLERSAAEFGFDQKGGITIACEVVLFEHLLWLIGTDDPSTRHLQVDELLDFYAY